MSPIDDWAFELPSLKYYACKAGVQIKDAGKGQYTLMAGPVVANNVPISQIKQTVDKLIPSVIKQKRRQIKAPRNK
jgi:hypothetical protein